MIGVVLTAFAHTNIVGARNVVVAVSRWTGRARPLRARVICGARIAVTARSSVVDVHTPRGRNADVIGTWIAVIAVRRLPTSTDPEQTRIIARTGVTVAAGV
jgi:hypothetical protein